MEGIQQATPWRSQALQAPAAWPRQCGQWPNYDYRWACFPSEFQANTPYISAPNNKSDDYLPPYPSIPPPVYINLSSGKEAEPNYIDVPGKQPRRVVSGTTGHPTEYDLAERPRTWRADYLSPSLSRFSKWLGETLVAIDVARDNATFRRKLGQKRVHMNRLLDYPGSHNAGSQYDLRQPPPRTQAAYSDQLVGSLDGYQLATSPPVHHLRAWHPLLPWYIDLTSTQPNGITINDVRSQVFEHLNKRVGAHDIFNVGLTAVDRGRLEQVYSRRCNGDISALKRGILRVDFLDRQFIFVGLQRGRHGVWEIKTRDGRP